MAAVHTGREKERWTDDITSIFERVISAQLLLGVCARAQQARLLLLSLLLLLLERRRRHGSRIARLTDWANSLLACLLALYTCPLSIAPPYPAEKAIQF